MAKPAQQTREDDFEILPPECRDNLIGHGITETYLRGLLESKSLSNGWMICGPAGVGKATLAYRLAKAVLSGSEFTDAESLIVNQDHKACRLIMQKAHPDLFIAERQWDEKKQRYATEITVDTIRSLISFMGQTAGSLGRIAIIDRADDLNRNAANALLKVLEEPPANALVLLVTNAPGRLLPTLRSRCRRVTLKPVETGQVADFLAAEGAGSGDAAQKLASVAGGSPGVALSLAVGNGTDAMPLVEDFLSRVARRKSVQAIAQKLAPVANISLWASFRDILLQSLSSAARAKAAGEGGEPQSLAHVPADRLVTAWTVFRDLANAGDALNTDRTQTILVAGTRLQQIFAGK